MSDETLPPEDDAAGGNGDGGAVPPSPESGDDGRDIRGISIDEELKTSYLDYAMSVIVSRALPDVRDGLKPVHRRILYTAATPEGIDIEAIRTLGAALGRTRLNGTDNTISGKLSASEPKSACRSSSTPTPARP